MYGSQDLEVCVHECRTTVDDLVFVATLSPARHLRLLELSAVLKEDGTEFESLDLSVAMLFLAGRHTYGICRQIATFARYTGFDGLVYPSYYTLARTGGMPFPTVYGLSGRRFPSQAEYIQATVIRNLALFGRPIAEGTVTVACINRGSSPRFPVKAVEALEASSCIYATASSSFLAGVMADRSC